MSNMTTYRQKVDHLKGVLEGALARNKHTLPRHLKPERVLRIVLGAASRNQTLLSCTPKSIALAVVTASQLGLEPGSPLGSAYLVPFKNRHTGRYEATLIIGYRGLIDLARRSGEIESIEAHVVHEKDAFRCVFGLSPVLEHEPAWTDDDPGKLVAVYAVARLKGGQVQTEVMTRAQVDGIRKRSRAGSSGPWVSDYDEMARKTVVRRLCKYLPMSIEMESALVVEDAGPELDSSMLDAEFKDEPLDDVIDVEVTATSEAKEKLKRQAPEKPPVTPVDAADVADAHEGQDETTGATERHAEASNGKGNHRDWAPDLPVPSCPDCGGPGARAKRATENGCFVCADTSTSCKARYKRLSEHECDDFMAKVTDLKADNPDAFKIAFDLLQEQGLPQDVRLLSGNDGLRIRGLLLKAKAKAKATKGPQLLGEILSRQVEL
jgi:phage RecT family recombinase